MAHKRRFPFAASWPDSLVIHLARLGPVGTLGFAPGTNGSAVGIVFTAFLFFFLPGAWVWTMTAIILLLAFPVCDEAEIRLGKSDPGEVILDEFAVIPLCFLGISTKLTIFSWQAGLWLFAGFLVFRLFDIAKPLGISKLQKFPGGYGVVLDDVAAALLTALVLHGVSCLI